MFLKFTTCFSCSSPLYRVRFAEAGRTYVVHARCMGMSGAAIAKHTSRINYAPLYSSNAYSFQVRRGPALYGCTSYKETRKKVPDRIPIYTYNNTAYMYIHIYNCIFIS